MNPTKQSESGQGIIDGADEPLSDVAGDLVNQILLAKANGFTPLRVNLIEILAGVIHRDLLAAERRAKNAFAVGDFATTKINDLNHVVRIKSIDRTVERTVYTCRDGSVEVERTASELRRVAEVAK